MSRADKIKHLRRLILRTGGELIPLANFEGEFTDTELDEEITWFEKILEARFTEEAI